MQIDLSSLVCAPVYVTYNTALEFSFETPHKQLIFFLPEGILTIWWEISEVGVEIYCYFVQLNIIQIFAETRISLSSQKCELLKVYKLKLVSFTIGNNSKQDIAFFNIFCIQSTFCWILISLD